MPIPDSVRELRASNSARLACGLFRALRMREFKSLTFSVSCVMSASRGASVFVVLQLDRHHLLDWCPTEDAHRSLSRTLPSEPLSNDQHNELYFSPSASRNALRYSAVSLSRTSGGCVCVGRNTVGRCLGMTCRCKCGTVCPAAGPS